MELSLLRLFTRGGRSNAELPAGLVDAIFQEDPLRSREILIEGGYFDSDVTVSAFVELITNYREARIKSDTKRRRDKAREVRKAQLEHNQIRLENWDGIIAQDELEIRRKERDKRESVAFHVPWMPRYLPSGDDPAALHSYWLTCFARVCFAHTMLQLTPRDSKAEPTLQEKMTMWLEAHIPMIAYLDNVADEHPNGHTDAEVEPGPFQDGYVGTPPATYPEDHKFIKRTSQMVENPRRPMPDDVLSEIGFEMPELLAQAADVYRMVTEDPSADIVQWLIEGTNATAEMGDRTAQAEAQRNRLPFFRCKKFTDARDVLDHCIWASVLLSLRQLGDIRSRGEAGRHKDAAYLWQLAFVELADMCERAGRFDDDFLLEPDTRCELSPLEVFWPYPGRAFHEGDLPNLLSVLALIPLRGEQHMPNFSISKIIGKSLAFACMRRLLTDTTNKAIRKDVAFWKVFSKMMQCMLWGTYPGSRSRLDGDTALVVYRLCADREGMIEKLAIEEDLSCRVIFTAVRAYLCNYGRVNSTYANACDDVIYWHGLVRDTKRMAEVIRETNLCAVDTFAEARVRLERHNKSSDAIVYRFRDASVALNLFKTVSKQLEDSLYAEMEDMRRDNKLYAQLVDMAHLESSDEFNLLWAKATLTPDRDALLMARATPGSLESTLRALITNNEESIERCRVQVPKEIKQNILNTMLYVPENMRFTEACFSELCKPEHGGLRRAVVHSLVRLVELYHERGPPKESQQQLSDFSPFELKVVTWFLHCACICDRVHLARLDPRTEGQIEQAMLLKRAVVYPGVQSMTPNDYMVYVTICCERVVTKRDGAYGHEDVRYDLDLRMPTCNRGNKTTKKAPEDHVPLVYPHPAETDTEVKDRAKKHKENFLRISCPKPVMRINLRGYKLILGNRRGTKKQYMHCPRCGCFHQVRTHNYLTQWGYACQDCLQQDRTKDRLYKCAYCKGEIEPRYDKETEEWTAPNTIVRVLRFTSDPGDRQWNIDDDPASMWQNLYFCQSHYSAAVAISHQRVSDSAKGKSPRYLDKPELFRRIGKSMMRNAERAMDIKFASRGIPRQK